MKLHYALLCSKVLHDSKKTFMICVFGLINCILLHPLFVLHNRSYLNRFPPQDEEVLCSHHHEPHKFMAEDLLNLIGLRRPWISLEDDGKKKACITTSVFSSSSSYLFDSNADSHGVYRPLDQDLLLVIAAYDHRLQQKLFAAPVLKDINCTRLSVKNPSFIGGGLWVISSPNLHLRLVVSLHHLRGEVLQTQGCLKSGAHCIQVGSQCCRLHIKNRIFN